MPSPSPPSIKRALIAIACFAIFCCTSTEKVVQPLGFGPLAKAEEAEHERQASLRPEVATKKSAQHTAAVDVPTHTPITSASAVEKSTKPHEPGAPAASASSAPLPSAPVKISDWVGLWRGKDTTRYQIPSFPSQPMDDPNAKIRIESSHSQQLKLVLIDSSNEQDICTLLAQLEGNLAKIDPGQPCFGTEDDSGNLAVRVKSGLATLRDTTLSLDVTLDADVQSEQFQANGTVEYHFEGKK
jgi:hypothetical protein